MLLWGLESILRAVDKLRNSLATEGFQLIAIPRDGNCLFSSIASQLQMFNISTSASDVRQQIVEFISDNPVMVTAYMYLVIYYISK